MKRDVAGSLGVRTLSDLKRYWAPAAARARAAADPPSPGERAVGDGAGQRARPARRVANHARRRRHRRDRRLRRPPGPRRPGPNIWTNFDETPGNGVDDDHNGFVDDVHGIDLTSKQRGQNLRDGNGHGTHVAGIVAAAANGRGVVGVAPQAKLMIVKVLDDNAAGTTGAVAEGIRYAAANGARVINLSLGGDAPDRSSPTRSSGRRRHVLVVASAGNNGRDIDKRPSYPAAIPAANLVAVASTDPSTGRDISEFSNFGRLTVQLAAPGGRSSPPATTEPTSSRAVPRWPLRWSQGSPPWPPASTRACRRWTCARCCCRTRPGRACRSPRATSTPSTACRRQLLRRLRHHSVAPDKRSSPPPARRPHPPPGRHAGLHRRHPPLPGVPRQARGRPRSRPAPAALTVTVRRRGARVRVQALDSAGHRVATAAQGQPAAQGQARRRDRRRRRHIKLAAAAALPRR